MKYQDRVYGEIKIDEPVLLEIISAPEFQRLKDVDQGGYYEVHYPGTKHTRFEHSLGVFELLRRYRASPEEQIAGLIHDISHSAFSHTMDYIVADGSGKTQCHQDRIFSDYVKNSSIAGILGKYNFDVDKIVDDSNFPLKENELPDICADRIDYSLRGLLAFKMEDRETINYFLDHLKAAQGKWFFDDIASAKKYAVAFKKLNDIHYSSEITAYMFRTTADYLKHAFSRGYINEDDFYTTDTEVLNKTREHHSGDPVLEKLWQRMENKIRWEVNKEDYDARVFCKSRAVDPFCQYQGSLKRVSEVIPGWKEIVTDNLKPKEHFIKFYD
ncbi:hypothetical protein COT99_03680 [Candidatus Falkowbacteria bacterium CG10_big_fil_rev_8_21_14_0_10_43_10]|uniref:HD/PDEase domain-containing protein n=1 Tax=Candidatus Falkowbacteria bacterium CG10_big_fil_rev_8_21_14_0_10_43_10 TaxID=1974567 RepID=A0A2H0V1J7_9BACT|nr:MAG: hypothetical protein COT99_03680 [Candidatus Falkowbacteria bacterium CG10_big_fil_rev_8_21_14_0_10_43_10]